MERAQNVKPLTVHKDGAEGVIQVDALTGAIITPAHERPEWSEGLAAALLQERHSFYEPRLGRDSEAFKSIMAADTINVEDLGWIGINAEQEEIEIEAIGEYRSEVVAKCLGINTEEGTLGDTVAEVEVDTKRHTMSGHERRIFEEAQQTGFGTEAEAEQQRVAK
jgi:hypothetical protein